MKKLFYVSAALLAFTIPGTAMANNGVMSSQDFKYLVCSYIEDSDSLEDALANAKEITDEVNTNNSQREIYRALADGTLTSEDYCVGLEF